MINFTNSLGGNCNFVYLKKFKEEVECFLQNQKIDNSNDAVEEFFLLSFSNKKSLQWLEGKFLTASTPSKIYANKSGFLRLFRKIHYHTSIPGKSFWYNDWKNDVKK